MPSFDELLNDATNRSVDERLIMLENISRSLTAANTSPPGSSEIKPTYSDYQAGYDAGFRQAEQAKNGKERIKYILGLIGTLIIFIISQYNLQSTVQSNFGEGRRTPPDNLDRLWVGLAMDLFFTIPLWLSLLLIFKKLPYPNWGLLGAIGLYLAVTGLILAQVSQKYQGEAIFWQIFPVIFAIGLTTYIWIDRVRIQRDARQLWLNK